MDRFPKMLFRFPGTLPDAAALQDGKYDLLTVGDDEAHDAAIAEGWSETAADARITADSIEAKLKAVPDTSDDDTKPPTRDKLKAKAKELGITHAHNVTDAKLLELIEAKLKA